MDQNRKTCRRMLGKLITLLFVNDFRNTQSSRTQVQKYLKTFDFRNRRTVVYSLV